MKGESEATIRGARAEAAGLLAVAGSDSAALDARLLLAHVLGESQTGLLIRDPDPLLPADYEQFMDLINQRRQGVPVSYLTGEREFMGLRFHTEPGVLVPRPDTEPLVEWGLGWLQAHPAATIADIGTGSGAIAISMVYHALPSWTGTLIATDISTASLDIAERNADAILSRERRSQISFQQGSLTGPLQQPIDLLITNLPYLTSGQIAENPDLRHEPHLALDGGDDGLDLVRQVIADLPRILVPGGAVGFEIDPSQSKEVQRLLTATLPNHRVEIVSDLAGDDRHVVASTNP